jgi:hypothetical protein
MKEIDKDRFRFHTEKAGISHPSLPPAYSVIISRYFTTFYDEPILFPEPIYNKELQCILLVFASVFVPCISLWLYHLTLNSAKIPVENLIVRIVLRLWVRTCKLTTGAWDFLLSDTLSTL